jgi:hypothetical protein
VDPSNAFAARTVAISREKLSGVVGAVGQTSESVTLMRAALATHRSLADRDPDNAQARCDAARVAESLGDLTHLPGEQASAGAGAACALWKESFVTRTALKEKRRNACTTEADLERLAIKLRPCGLPLTPAGAPAVRGVHGGVASLSPQAGRGSGGHVVR